MRIRIKYIIIEKNLNLVRNRRKNQKIELKNYIKEWKKFIFQIKFKKKPRGFK